MTESESIQAALRDFARTLGGLQATVTTLTQQWRDQDEKASQGRRALYDKIDGLVEDLRTLEGLVKAAISDIAFMKPIVDGVLEARQEVQGVVKVGRWVYWAATAGGGGGVLWMASHFITVTLK